MGPSLAKEKLVVHPNVYCKLDLLPPPESPLCARCLLKKSFFPIWLTLLIFTKIFKSIFKDIMSPGCVAQWIECWPADRKVADAIPSLGTCLGCGPG